MSTFEDRPRTALLVIDVQEGVVANAFAREQVISSIAGLVTKARDADTAVVWVQHSDAELERGSAAWRIVPDLEPLPTESVVQKTYGDSFEATDLEQVLGAAAVGHVVVTGAQTDACIRSTIHGAFTRGYDVTLVGDAHTTDDLSAWGAPEPDGVIRHTNMYWQYQSAPGRTAQVVPADDVSFVRA